MERELKNSFKLRPIHDMIKTLRKALLDQSWNIMREFLGSVFAVSVNEVCCSTAGVRRVRLKKIAETIAEC
jgi:hypothetical protein